MATKTLGNGYKLSKEGKLLKVPVYRDVSHKIRQAKSKRVKVVAPRAASR